MNTINSMNTPIYAEDLIAQSARFIKGKGCKLYDKNNSIFLNLHAPNSPLGCCPEILKENVASQLEKFWSAEDHFIDRSANQLKTILSQKADLHGVMFASSANEGVECAIQLARKRGKGKSTIIASVGGYHGSTYGALSASGEYKLWADLLPITPGFVYTPYNNIDALEASLNKDAAAVILETVQTHSGLIFPENDYLQKVKLLCAEKDILLILDESKISVGRTGKFFAFENYNVTPDIVVVSSGLANGLPLSATIYSEKLRKAAYELEETVNYYGNPISTAAACSVASFLDASLLDYLTQLGDRIISSIESKFYSSIKVKGKGLMISIEFENDIKANAVAGKLLEFGIVAAKPNNKFITILPPYILSNSEAEEFLFKLDKVLADLMLEESPEELIHNA